MSRCFPQAEAQHKRSATDSAELLPLPGDDAGAAAFLLLWGNGLHRKSVPTRAEARLRSRAGNARHPDLGRVTDSSGARAFRGKRRLIARPFGSWRLLVSQPTSSDPIYADR